MLVVRDRAGRIARSHGEKLFCSVLITSVAVGSRGFRHFQLALSQCEIRHFRGASVGGFGAAAREPRSAIRSPFDSCTATQCRRARIEWSKLVLASASREGAKTCGCGADRVCQWIALVPLVRPRARPLGTCPLSPTFDTLPGSFPGWPAIVARSRRLPPGARVDHQAHATSRPTPWDRWQRL